MAISLLSCSVIPALNAHPQSINAATLQASQSSDASASLATVTSVETAYAAVSGTSEPTESDEDGEADSADETTDEAEEEVDSASETDDDLDSSYEAAEATDESGTLEVPTISAGAAIVMDCDTGTILYALNENTQMPMASTTKIMTCILALEAGDIGRTVTVTEDYYTSDLDGSTLIGLEVGDTITLYDLCVAMMMYSGNDAANVAAVEIGGSIDGFVSMMNEKACEIGMLNTHFDTPSGLDQDSDGAHYSTAYDMALLAQYAMQNADFRDIVKFQARSIYYDDYPNGRLLLTHNYLLSGQDYAYDGCDGIKTGYTTLAGQCLVSHITSDEGLSLVCVTLNDANRWTDHAKLYDYAKSLYTQLSVNDDISEFDSVIVGGTKKSFTVECDADETFNILKSQVDSVEKQVVFDQFIYAPVEEGDVVGYLQYVADGVVVASYPITATESVESTTGGWFSEYIQAIEYSSQGSDDG